MNKGVVIIGAGHAGVNLAIALRSEQYEEPITLLSNEADLPYNRPPLSKTYIKGEDQAAEESKLKLRPETFYREKNIAIRLNTQVTAIDSENSCLTLADNSTLEYELLVLACGTRARILPLPGAELDGVVVLRTLEDARRIRAKLPAAEHIVIIGGGFIGLEFAASARQLGKDVTVLEAAPRIMGRSVAPQISEYVTQQHRENGIQIVLNAQVEKIIGNTGKVATIQGKTGEWPAELVIMGVGAEPNVELAEAAGLACDNGVLVDAHMRTSVSNIFSIGDCAVHRNPFADDRQLRLESIQNATDQARVAAQTLSGKDGRYHAVPWFWSDQGDMKLQMAGLSFDATDYIIRGTPESGKFSVFHYRDDTLVAIDSINQAMDHLLGRKLITAGISPDKNLVADLEFSLKSLLS